MTGASSGFSRAAAQFWVSHEVLQGAQGASRVAPEKSSLHACCQGEHVIPEFTQTHVHQVSDAIQPSHLLSSPSSPTFNLFQHQGLFQESALRIRWPKYWRSPVAYWAPTNLGSSSFSILSFCLFILFMGFSRQDNEMVCHSLLL